MFADTYTLTHPSVAKDGLVTIKEVQADGRIALDDGRILGEDYGQFVRGYAVTSYAAQGKTVDYVLFSDSAVKAATHDQQWYVTISRGRKGIKIFTADKHQLRQNVTRAGDRSLALNLAKPKRAFAHVLARVWRRSVTYVVNVQRAKRDAAQRQAETIRHSETVRQTQSIKPTHAQQQAISRGIRV